MKNLGLYIPVVILAVIIIAFAFLASFGSTPQISSGPMGIKLP